MGGVGGGHSVEIEYSQQRLVLWRGVLAAVLVEASTQYNRQHQAALAREECGGKQSDETWQVLVYSQLLIWFSSSIQPFYQSVSLCTPAC